MNIGVALVADARSFGKDIPLWRLVELAAHELTRAGRAPFTRRDLIEIVQRSRRAGGADSINPIIQGVTDNLRGGALGAVGKDILHSVSRGQFVLRNAASAKVVDAPVASAAPAKGSPSADAVAIDERNGVLQLGGCDLVWVCEITPARSASGDVEQFLPQDKYNNSERLSLNRHGSGPFCRFRIPPHIHAAGVYAILVDREPRYVGECVDLSKRYNMGYGLISPRNCFQRGQETNCRINNLVLQAAQRGCEIVLWFYATPEHKTVERQLLKVLRPSLNR